MRFGWYCMECSSFKTQATIKKEKQFGWPMCCNKSMQLAYEKKEKETEKNISQKEIEK